jgi:hypothetical protein
MKAKKLENYPIKKKGNLQIEQLKRRCWKLQQPKSINENMDL